MKRLIQNAIVFFTFFDGDEYINSDKRIGDQLLELEINEDVS
jgi:hypothetical protein